MAAENRDYSPELIASVKDTRETVLQKYGSSIPRRLLRFLDSNLYMDYRVQRLRSLPDFLQLVQESSSQVSNEVSGKESDELPPYTRSDSYHEVLHQAVFAFTECIFKSELTQEVEAWLDQFNPPEEDIEKAQKTWWNQRCQNYYPLFLGTFKRFVDQYRK